MCLPYFVCSGQAVGSAGLNGRYAVPAECIAQHPSDLHRRGTGKAKGARRVCPVTPDARNERRFIRASTGKNTRRTRRPIVERRSAGKAKARINAIVRCWVYRPAAIERGLMQAAYRGSFADPAVEARFQETARILRLPFVRIYGVLFMLVAPAYTIANPLFVSHEDTATLAVYFGCMLILSGAYIGATFWSGYVARPGIDFAALLGIVFLLGHINLVLFDELIDMQEEMHAVGV